MVTFYTAFVAAMHDGTTQRFALVVNFDAADSPAETIRRAVETTEEMAAACASHAADEYRRQTGGDS